MESEMHIPHEKAINYDIDRAHRMPGGKNPGDSPRPLVVHFCRSYDKQEVMSFKDKVSDGYGVSDQYPAEWSETRLALKISMNQLQDVPQKEKKLVGNKLFVKNEVFTPNVLSAASAPRPYDASKIKCWDSVPKVEWTDSINEQGNVFQSCGAKVDSLETAKLMLDTARAMCSRQPDHISYAYIIEKNGETFHHIEDDKEWGAGRRLYKLISETPGSHNKIVMICRWFSGVHIGKTRWEIHEKLAKDMLLKLRSA